MSKKKQIFIILSIIIVIALIIFFVTRGVKEQDGNAKQEVDVTNLETKGIYEIFDASESNSSKNDVETVTSKGESVASKYKTNSTSKVVNAKVELMDIEGKVIYTKDGNDDITVFQAKYKIEEKEDMPPAIELNQYMNEFKMRCISYLELEPDTKPEAEKLYGEDTTQAPIPVEESIYYENRLYSVTYKTDKTMYSREEFEMVEERKKDGTVELVEKKVEPKAKSYDVNFYMSNGYLVCELATKQ